MNDDWRVRAQLQSEQDAGELLDELAREFEAGFQNPATVARDGAKTRRAVGVGYG